MLFLSFCMPPLKYPRSIQISRLIKNMPFIYKSIQLILLGYSKEPLCYIIRIVTIDVSNLTSGEIMEKLIDKS